MIIYFSGTGNSRRVAHIVGEILADDITVELRGDILLSPCSASLPAIKNGERIIWVCPVYSWGLPVVAKFIKECTIDGAEMAKHHLVVTCGDDTGLTAEQWRILMNRRGWTPVTASSVIMPNTYVLMKGFDVDTTEIEKEKLDACRPRVEEICRMITVGKVADSMLHGRFAWVKSKVIYPWFIKHAMSPKPFHATDGRTLCGKCVRICPMNNITLSPGEKPAWHDHCALCLGCYHTCPHHAVAYGKATDNKGQSRL